MPWFSRNDTAWLSRSENSATSTLAPVTSLRPGRLDVDGGALDDALEARGRQRLARRLGDDALEAVVDEGLEIVPQAVDIDAAGLEHRRRILVLRHRQQQVLERRVFVPALAGEAEGAVEGSSRGSWTAWTSNHLD